jgi:hypothetical protein
MKYRLADHVTCRSTNTELRMLFDRQRGVMYKLNESASAIVYSFHEGAQSRASLIERLSCEFDGESSQIEADIDDFLEDFERVGLIRCENE